jgi:hypothetical protein
MTLPADFDRTKWLDPLTFEGLVGAALASGDYALLFREDGFAKPIADLRSNKRTARLLAHVQREKAA